MLKCYSLISKDRFRLLCVKYTTAVYFLFYLKLNNLLVRIN